MGKSSKQNNVSKNISGRLVPLILFKNYSNLLFKKVKRKLLPRMFNKKVSSSFSSSVFESIETGILFNNQVNNNGNFNRYDVVIHGGDNFTHTKSIVKTLSKIACERVYK